MTLVQGKCGQERFILPVRQVTDPLEPPWQGRREDRRGQGRVCRVCEPPPGYCQCGNVDRAGRWVRSGTSIVAND